MAKRRHKKKQIKKRSVSDINTDKLEDFLDIKSHNYFEES